MKNLSIRQLTVSAAVIVLFVVAAVAAIGVIALGRSEKAAADMAMGKDLVADILPPPLYVIEAELTAYELLRATPEQRAVLAKHLTQLRAQYDERNRYWETSSLDAGLAAALLGGQRAMADRFWEEIDKVYLPAIGAGDLARAESSMSRLRQHYAAHRAAVDRTVALGNAFAERSLTALSATSNWGRGLMVSVGVSGLLIVLAAMAIMLAQVRARLGGEPAQALDVTQRIAEGDLGSSAGEAREGVLGALERMRGNLRRLIGDISDCASELAAAAPRLLDRADKARENAEQQFANASEIARAAEELSASTVSAADHAGAVSDRVAAASEMALDGGRNVRESVARMQRVAQTVEQAVVRVQELGRQSGEISGIVQVIREIAEQTNLLALNAAIEAARAGESGRGFAVVADEVRKLAERTGKSTAEIEQMVERIQAGTTDVIRNIETTARSAAEAAGDSESVAVSIGRIEGAVRDIGGAIREVAGSLSEQKQIAQSVSEAVDRVSRQAEGSLQRASGNADEARALVSLSDRLRGSATRFRV